MKRVSLKLKNKNKNREMTYKIKFKNVYKYNIFATTYKNKWIKIFGLILKVQKR